MSNAITKVMTVNQRMVVGEKWCSMLICVGTALVVWLCKALTKEVKLTQTDGMPDMLYHMGWTPLVCISTAYTMQEIKLI